MADRLEGSNQFTANIPGAEGATLEQISEVVRGSTIKAIRKEKAISPEGGECIMLEINNGDRLIFVAQPGSYLAVDGPSAYIQPFLMTRRNTKLKA